MTITLSTQSEGSYQLRVPEGLVRRQAKGQSSPYWYAYVNGEKRKTPYRWDGGSKAQSQLNLKLAAEFRTQCLAGQHLPQKLEPISYTMTIEKMIDMWLLGFPKESRRRQDEADRMAHWKRELGTLPYNEVKPSTIKAAAARLVERGLAESTVNRMLTSLQACFRDHITESEPNPVERVVRYHVDKAVPGGRAIDYTLIARVLATMPDMGQSANGHGKVARKDAIPRPTVNKTKLRLAVMAYIGLPPQLITEIQPKVDVRFDKNPPELRVRPRKKGGGTNERWVTLNPQGADALRALIAGDATGNFSRHSAYKSWMAACVKVIEKQIAAGEEPMRHKIGKQTRTRNGKTKTRTIIKPLVRPYDLRHSFITKLAIDSDGDLMGVQHNSIHSTPQQAAMYAQGAMSHEGRKVTASWKMPVTKKRGRVLKIKRAR